MAYKFNPFTGKLDLVGPVLTGTGTVSAAADGTEELPGIAFASDLNTGISRPGDDQLAISTDGTGRLFIDASGNVGIGTDSPDALFHVEGNSGSTSPGSTSLLRVESIGSGTDTGIRFKSAGSTYSQIGSIGGDLYAYTDGNERARIDSSGNVGIGTSSPSELLEVDGGNLRVKNFTAGNNITLSTHVGNGNDSTLKFLKARGGNSTPAQIVVGDDLGSIEWQGYDGSSYNEAAQIRCKANTNTGDFDAALVYNADNHVFQNSGSESVRIDDSGRLLVGTSTARTDFEFETVSIEPLSQIESTGKSTALSITRNSDSRFAGTIYLGKSRGETLGSSTVVQDSDRLGSISFNGADGDRLIQAVKIDAEVDGTPGSNNMPGRLVFSTNSGGTTTTERMRIDSSGSLLVGTTTVPTGSSTQYTKFGVFGNNLNTGASVLSLSYGTAATSLSTGTGIGRIYFGDTGAAEFASIAAETDEATGTGDYPGRLLFYTTANGASSPTERMRITNNGTIYIGNISTITGEGLVVQSASNNASYGSLYVLNSQNTSSHPAASFATAVNSTATSNVLVKFGINSYNSGSGQINANGPAQAAFGTFSDARLKENITDLASQWENFKNLRPVEFDYIESQGGEHQIGFIAQEFETVYPDAVGTSPMFVGIEEESDEERLTLTGWSKTEARLVKVLQEAIAKIETLEAKVAALEAQ